MLTSPITRFWVDAVRYTDGVFLLFFHVSVCFFGASLFCLRRVRALYKINIVGFVIHVCYLFYFCCFGF